MTASSAVLSLVLSIKRGVFRSKDSGSEMADQVLRSKRPGVLSRHRMTCRACGYKVRVAGHLDVHHLDDDHANNDDDNLAALCHTCHPVNHIGEISHRSEFAEGLGAKTLLAYVPEIEPSDMGLLQRAIGAALHDPALRDQARAIQQELLARSDITREMFGTWHAKDFAGALAQLTPAQYALRAEVLQGQRLMFNEPVLRHLGKELYDDYPSLPPGSWPQATQGLDAAQAQEA